MMSFKLANRMANMAESSTLALNARAKKLAAEGKTIYNLTAGELDIETPDYIQTFVSKNLNLNKYTPVAGLPELRQGIAGVAGKFYGLDWVGSDNVLVTAGAKPALNISLLALLNPGDEVIVLTPAWVSYQNIIELAGGVAVKVPLSDSFDLELPAITKKISARTKAIIVNSPHNPTGSVFSKSSLKALAEALKGSNIIVIADDVYSRLVYEKDFMPVPSIGFEHLLIVNSFSKSQGLTGWRIGYAIADAKIINAMTSLQSHVAGNAALPSQQAALAAVQRGDNPPEGMLDSLEKCRQLAVSALDKIPGIKYHHPSGAIYIFLDLRSITQDSATWCENLLNQYGVAVVPGEAFGSQGFCRLTFATDMQVLQTALTLICKFVSSERVYT